LNLNFLQNRLNRTFYEFIKFNELIKSPSRVNRLYNLQPKLKKLDKKKQVSYKRHFR